MTKMSRPQRTAILGAFENRNDDKVSVWTFGRRNTVESLRRNGWIAVDHMPTRAGLIAAGVDMDAIHAEALEIDAMCCTLNPLGHARTECPGWTDRLSTEGRQVIRDAAHAEALTEYREITRTARKADADAYQRGLARSMGLRVRAA